MIARIRKSMEQKDQGFTLIELLVVMIIIGILAAIAIPIFMNQRKKANDSAATSDISTLGKEVATYYVDATVALSGVAVTAAPARLTVGGVDVGKASNNVTSATLSHGSTATVTAASTSWCVTMVYTGGTVDPGTVYYSALNGLSKTGC